MSLKVERRLTADLYVIDGYDSTNVNNTTLVQKDIKDTSPCANSLGKRKRGRSNSKFPIEKDNLDSPDEDMVKCDSCDDTFTQKQMRRHVSRWHNAKMMLCHACRRLSFKKENIHK